MAIVTKVLRRETGLSHRGDPYTRTYAEVESRRFGTVSVYGYGLDYAVGDAVMLFFHDKYDAGKMIRIR